jgi:hypothetical protein
MTSAAMAITTTLLKKLGPVWSIEAPPVNWGGELGTTGTVPLVGVGKSVGAVALGERLGVTVCVGIAVDSAELYEA